MPRWTSSACGEGGAAATVIKWEAGDSYFIQSRKDGEPQEEGRAENMTQKRNDVAIAVWDPLGDNEASQKDTTSSWRQHAFLLPQSPSAAGRGHSAGSAPAHGDTITLNSSCGRKRGDLSRPEESTLPPPFPQLPLLQPNKWELRCYFSYLPWHFKFSRFWALYQLCSHYHFINPSSLGTPVAICKQAKTLEAQRG